MAQNRYYSSRTKRTNTTLDPGASGATLTVLDTSSYAVLDATTPYILAINWGLGDQELVSCTARPTGTTFTIVRGVGGTTAQPHAPGATVDHFVYDADFTELASHRGSDATPTTTGVHGVSGNVVGTTDVQTLSGKTYILVTNSYTANHTATTTEQVLLASASGGAFTITLPTAVGVTGQSYTVKKTDVTANAVTIATTASQTIDGSANYVLYTPTSVLVVVSDGTNWQIMPSTYTPPPSLGVYRNAADATGGEHIISWDAEDYQSNVATNQMHSVSTNTSRLTAPIPGKYLITVQTSWSNTTSNLRYYIKINKNGAGALNTGTLKMMNLNLGTSNSSEQCGFLGSCVVPLAAGDYIELQSRPPSGTQTIVSGSQNTWCQMLWAGP